MSSEATVPLFHSHFIDKRGTKSYPWSHFRPIHSGSGLAPLKSFSPAELWWLYEKNFGKSFPMTTGYNIFATDGRSAMPPFIQLKVWNLITKHGRRMSNFFFIAE